MGKRERERERERERRDQRQQQRRQTFPSTSSTPEGENASGALLFFIRRRSRKKNSTSRCLLSCFLSKKRSNAPVFLTIQRERERETSDEREGSMVVEFLRKRIESLDGFFESDATSTSDTRDVVATLVIAHPDDECMFFSPALASLAGRSSRRLCSSPPPLPLTSKPEEKYPDEFKWTVLCLSNGDAFGKGKVREKELLLSCETFEISPDDVELVSDSRLQDGMEEEWSPLLVAEYIRKHVRTKQTTHLVGFDEKGISKHPNHLACAEALRILAKEDENETIRTGTGKTVWVLRTLGGISTYFGVLVLLRRLLLLPKRKRNKAKPKRTKNEEVVCVQFSCEAAFNAMKKHKSQLVWYRYLHLIFSRYVYINVLHKL